MSRVAAALLALGVAMHMRYTSELVAWSNDGTAALLRTVSDGPEGGSSTTYRLVDLANGKELAAVVADDLSQGAGPHDNLDRAKCRAELEAMAPPLKAFAQVGVEPAKCQLRVNAAQPGEKLELVLSGGEALLKKSGQTVAHAHRETIEGLAAYASPNGRAVLMIATDDYAPVRGAWIGPGGLKALAQARRR